jgi:glycine/D-amino acid oxidase-like deaminating enzyme
MGRNNGEYVSLWLEEALAEEQPERPSAADPVPARADVVIVGGGFTGLWAAIRLREHDASLHVCLIEARYCGYGASGRNGGIVEGSWPKLPTMRRLFGEADGIRLAQTIDAGLDDLRSFCKANSIDAQIRWRGHLWLATNQSQLGSWDMAVQAAELAPVSPFKPIDGDRARSLSGSPLVLGGVLEEHSASLQPALLVRGLRRAAIANGVKIYEYTAMTSVEGTSPVLVATNRGTIRAEKVILATNAWSASHPELKPYLFVTSSDIVATRRVPEFMDGEPLGSGIALSDSRRLILYWRSTPDGRLVFGKGGGWMSRGNRIDGRFTGESALSGSVISRMRRLYPSLRGVPIEYSWNGPIDYSSTGLPYFGPLTDTNPAILVGAGYSGNGVVPTVLGGRILASLVLGRDDEYASLPLVRRWPRKILPDPFRSLGAPLVKVALTRKELLLDAEAEPGRLLNLIAGLDPTASPSQSESD